MNIYTLFIQNNEIIKSLIIDAAGISIACMFVTFPIAFNLSIIPSIEKKLNKKLKFTNVVYEYGTTLGNKIFARPMDISFYIVGKLFKKLIGLNPDIKSKSTDNILALQKVNYPFKMFSIMEIFWSVMLIIALTITFGGGLFLIFLDKVLHL